MITLPAYSPPYFLWDFKRRVDITTLPTVNLLRVSSFLHDFQVASGPFIEAGGHNRGNATEENAVAMDREGKARQLMIAELIARIKGNDPP